MIRPFNTKTDMAQVLSIWVDTSIEAHSFIPREFWVSKLDDMRNLYLPSSETYVYEEMGFISGFISLAGNTIAALFVLPAHQGKGIGTGLIGKAREMHSPLHVHVYTENDRAVSFYEKNGFMTVHEDIDGHTGHPELVMTSGSLQS